MLLCTNASVVEAAATVANEGTDTSRPAAVNIAAPSSAEEVVAVVVYPCKARSQVRLTRTPGNVSLSEDIKCVYSATNKGPVVCLFRPMLNEKGICGSMDSA